MAGSLAGRTALVTGAGRGIGRAIAIGLAQAGADVLVTARSADEVAYTVAAIEAAAPGAGKARMMTADIADNRQRQQVIDAGLARGRVDVLINNAATVEPLGASAAIWAGDLRQAFEVNVIAPAVLAAAVVPGMVAAGWGRIVNVSSAIVDSPASMVGGNAYAATKSALEAHSRNLAVELAGTGVTVNVYRPGRRGHGHAGVDPFPGPGANRGRVARPVPGKLCQRVAADTTGLGGGAAGSLAGPGR